jgi:hypothetical protein
LLPSGVGTEDVWRPGGRIEGYRLEALLGRGGMGQVFRAVHEESGAVRAVKTLLPGAEPEELLRFAREGEAQAKVDAHPAVARIHGVGSAHGRPFIVLELCGGGSLAERLARGPLPWRAAAELVRRLAAGVAHLHAHGVLHRDLKPENVLFDDEGHPRLVDFGLARLAGATSLTASGTILGTPAYLSPEQACGLPAGRPADVHALGLLLLTCLAGASPFVRKTLAATLAAVMTEVAPRPSALDPAAPAALDRLCGACLAKEPAERPTAAALDADLGALLAEVGAGSSARWSRGTPLAAALLLGAAAAGTALCGWAAAPEAPPARPAPSVAPVPSVRVDAAPPASWGAFRRSFEALRPRRVFMCPLRGGAHSATVALSPDGKRAAAAVGTTVRVFDVDPEPVARHTQERSQNLNDLEWTGGQVVGVSHDESVTWTPGAGWASSAGTGGARLAFDGAQRIDTPIVKERSGLDLVDVVASGRTLVSGVAVTALAARGGRVAIAGSIWRDGLLRQLVVLPLSPDAPEPAPAPSSPLMTATITCLLWLDDATLALATSDADVLVLRDGAWVELVTPGLTHGELAEGERVAGVGPVPGLAGAGDRLVAGSLDLKLGEWELAAWSVSSPGAPRARLQRQPGTLLALAGTDRRVVALVDRGGDVSLLVFDLPPWPGPGG